MVEDVDSWGVLMSERYLECWTTIKFKISTCYVYNWAESEKHHYSQKLLFERGGSGSKLPYALLQEGFNKKAALRFLKNSHPAKRCICLQALKYRREIILFLLDICRFLRKRERLCSGWNSLNRLDIVHFNSDQGWSRHGFVAE
jgi:hypothetical protein